MKKLEYVLMILVVLSALFSIYINFEGGFHKYSWQLCTLIWIGIAYMKNDTIKYLERKIKENSKN